jgi:hypothetical protein
MTKDDGRLLSTYNVFFFSFLFGRFHVKEAVSDGMVGDSAMAYIHRLNRVWGRHKSTLLFCCHWCWNPFCWNPLKRDIWEPLLSFFFTLITGGWRLCPRKIHLLFRECHVEMMSGLKNDFWTQRFPLISINNGPSGNTDNFVEVPNFLLLVAIVYAREKKGFFSFGNSI